MGWLKLTVARGPGAQADTETFLAWTHHSDSGFRRLIREGNAVNVEVSTERKSAGKLRKKGIREIHRRRLRKTEPQFKLNGEQPTGPAPSKRDEELAAAEAGRLRVERENTELALENLRESGRRAQKLRQLEESQRSEAERERQAFLENQRNLWLEAEQFKNRETEAHAQKERQSAIARQAQKEKDKLASRRANALFSVMAIPGAIGLIGALYDRLELGPLFLWCIQHYELASANLWRWAIGLLPIRIDIEIDHLFLSFILLMSTSLIFYGARTSILRRGSYKSGTDFWTYFTLFATYVLCTVMATWCLFFLLPMISIAILKRRKLLHPAMDVTMVAATLIPIAAFIVLISIGTNFINSIALVGSGLIAYYVMNLVINNIYAGFMGPAYILIYSFGMLAFDAFIEKIIIPLKYIIQGWK